MNSRTAFLTLSLLIVGDLADGQSLSTVLRSHGAIVRGDTTQKTIALVFTGHEFAEGGNTVLAVLAKHQAHGSFFLTGDFYRRPEFAPLVRQIRDRGHYLGAHSDKHLLYADWGRRDSLLVTRDSFFSDLWANYRELHRFGVTRDDASIFLPPFEWYNSVVSRWCADSGITLVNFTTGTSSNADYTTHDMGLRYASSDTILTRIFRYERTSSNGLNGFLLLTHIGTHPDRTDKFYHKLDTLIAALRGRGYSFARVDRLPGISETLRQRSNQISTTVVLLGTGMPYPDPKAQGPSTAVVVGKRVFVVDAGAGVMRQLSAAGLGIRGPEALFITHLHSDHTLGYPDLIFTSWVMHRKAPFGVYGPPGLKRMTNLLYDSWREDIDARVKGLERQTPDGYKVAVHEVREGVIYDSAGVRVTAIPVPHGIWKHAFAFRFDTPDRTIVISGDAAPSEKLIAASRGVDVLVHEVYPSSRIAPENRPGGEDWPEYLRTFHTSDKELGNIAAKAQPKLLILSHIVRMGGTDEEMIEEIRRGGYLGRVVVGRDLERY